MKLGRFVAALGLALTLPLSAGASDSRFIELDGFINPYLVVNVGSGVTGILDEVLVEKSDLVKKGQVLVRLDSKVEEATVELSRARLRLIDATIELGRARLAFATREYRRKNELYEKDSLAFYEKDKAETDMTIAELDLAETMEQKRVAELELKQAQEVLERRTIRSPITGVVVERFLAPGELVFEQPILKLAQMDTLRVQVIAPVSIWGSIGVGMKAEVTPESPLARVYKGSVTIVDRLIDAGSGTFGIEIGLSNKDYSLPAGLRCRVRFLEPNQVN